MTMREKIRVHNRIAKENREHFLDWQMMMAYEMMTASEVREMIRQKDRAMEWDEQFGFLCDLLDRKERVAV